MNKILIIEDDPAISIGLKESLEKENYHVATEDNGDRALSTVSFERPDLIILDVMLPGMNGFEICKELRSSGNFTPIIVLTAKNEEVDKVLGLELGADDYVTKPFSIRELAARIKGILRRRMNIEQDFDTFSFGDISINFKKMECKKGSKNVDMSLKEYEIIKFFAKHEEEVVTRNQLLDEVWGYETFPSTRTVDNYILMLRKKIEDNPSVPKHILTIHSAGYKFVK
jgi:DNA-binding response OmpR family regulator